MDAQSGVVLLHGSELGSWIWQRVVPLLEAPAVAVDLPGRGAPPPERRRVTLEAAVQHVVRAAQELERDDDRPDDTRPDDTRPDDTRPDDARPDGPRRDGGGTGRQEGRGLVLVAHSASGVLVPPVVAALGGRVRAVVLLATAVPEPGKSFVEQQPLVLRLFLRALYRVRPEGVLSPRGPVERSLCAGLDAESTALVLRHRVPEPPGILLGRPATAALPTVHLVAGRGDGVLPLAAQTRGMARLAPGQAVLHEVDGGHLAMLGAPAQVAALLDRIARQAGASPPPVPP